MSLRRYLQLFFFVLCVYGGFRFYSFVESLKSGNLDVVKPGIVEGFLPISALMSLKRLLVTGNYDFVHPAGLTILLTAIVISIIFKKSFCSVVCPVGFVSEIISEIGMKIRINKWLFYIFASVKYALLLFFVYVVFYQMSMVVIESFLGSPYNIVADAKMLKFFLNPSRTTVVVLSILLFLTLLFKNLWCRVLCPYGALMGLFSYLSPFKVVRNRSACSGCMSCSRACPMDISVHEKEKITSPECFGCYECVQNRSKKECLKVAHMKNYKAVHPLAAVIVILICVSAIFTGFWNSQVDNAIYLKFLGIIDMLTH